jgi:hypothetical protein
MSDVFNGQPAVDSGTGALYVEQVEATGVPVFNGQPAVDSGTGAVLVTVVGGGGSGTVTSVGLTMPTGFAVANSPVTSTGTLAVTISSQSASTFLVSPAGSAGAPVFRTVTVSDISGAAPSLSPGLTGVPTAPTANPGTSTAQIATTAFVQNRAFRFTGFTSGTFAASQVVYQWSVTDAGTLPAALVNSRANLAVAATSSTAFTLNHNGTSFGTLTFSASGTVASVASSAVTVAAGDLITVVAPAIPDATAAGLSITLSA